MHMFFSLTDDIFLLWTNNIYREQKDFQLFSEQNKVNDF